MRFSDRTLGRTGVTVGPLGISASYGVPAAAVERAVEAGMTYVYWGSMRTAAFAEALRHLAPKRDRFMLVVQSYARLGPVLTWSVERALRRIGYEHADVLLLGYWNRGLRPRILDAARVLQRRGLVNFVAVSSHNRPGAASLAAGGEFDIVHVRYNAAHPGAERAFFPALPVAFLFWRKKVLLNRMLGNILIAAGALMPAMAGSFVRAGLVDWLYLSEFTGVVLMYSGVLLATASQPVKSSTPAVTG